jgi:hypothetical protein
MAQGRPRGGGDPRKDPSLNLGTAKLWPCAAVDLDRG